jgi:hypothetical protein
VSRAEIMVVVADYAWEKIFHGGGYIRNLDEG